MRENDKIAISKVVAGLTKGPSNTVRSPLAACVLIRKCCVLLEDEERPGETPHMDFLEVGRRSNKTKRPHTGLHAHALLGPTAQQRGAEAPNTRPPWTSGSSSHWTARPAGAAWRRLACCLA